MPAAPVLATKTNGVLAVNAAQTASGGNAKSGKRKAVATGKKVVIRRLAPGMTQEEFWACLGDDWKSGRGKVDWTRWESGKISKDPFKPSKPSRCYMRILKLEDVPALSDMVRSKTWEDSKNTWNDACLVGPVYVEIAQIQKVATSKRRSDPRQGTIDQDPDFVAFLESLNNAQNADKEPKNTENAEPAVDDTPKEAKVTITPLVQYLKDKKANKAKEAANAKSAKQGRQEASSSKAKGQEESTKKKGKDGRNDKTDSKDKPKEPVKLLTKKAAQQEAVEAAKAAAGNKAASEAKTAENKEEATPKSRRAGIAAAAKILQRDLGLSPGSAHRRARQDAAKAEPATKSEGGKTSKEQKEPAAASASTPAKTSTPTGPAASSSRASEASPSASKAQAVESGRRARGKGGKQNTPVAENSKGKKPATSNSKPAATPPTPVILKREDKGKAPASSTPTAASSTTAATPSAQAAPSASSKGGSVRGAKGNNQQSQKKASAQSIAFANAARGFIKHANPSQGVTEALLKQAMEAFGPVSFVEIDKRKGFAYVDFANAEGLAKAMTASPVAVAQATVQVLERKEKQKVTAPNAVAAGPSAVASTTTNAQSVTAEKTAQPAVAEKTGAEKTAEGQSERPKRGGRGRGRKGGGNGGNVGSKNEGSEGKTNSGPATASASSVPSG